MKMLTGVFFVRERAECAIQDLQTHGFSDQQFSILMSGPAHELHFAGSADLPADHEDGSFALGGTLAPLFGKLTALSSLAVAGGVYFAGPLGEAVESAAAEQPSLNLSGALRRAGLPWHEAAVLALELNQDRILITIAPKHEAQARRARRVFDENGACVIPGDAALEGPRANA